ncbi:MAG: hypothetical protein N2Z79_00770, partial [Candidatus Omnitrophica bacterium]|nr:hypothetical protein [Candidatus Omnitrophota bacterium]
MKKKDICGIIFICSFCFITLSFAQTIEQIPKVEEEIEKEKRLREKIEKEKPRPEIKEEAPVTLPAPRVGEQKVFIKTIEVIGATLLTTKEIKNITSAYENKELTLSQMQKITDLITDAYREKGFITSRAYLPPQKIEEGTLEIRILEGITGNVEVKGNRYFKAGLLRRKIALEKGQPFNYE